MFKAMPTLVSWNVNGLRSVIGKGFSSFLEKKKPAVLCLQEIKIDAAKLAALQFPYPHLLWHSAQKPGYSGTAILSHHKPLRVVRDLPGEPPHPLEGRLLAAEFDDFWLVNVYVPNSQRELTRLAYRQNHWDPGLRKYLAGLARKKPVVVCGDFNVAHEPIDLANPQANRRNAGFTDEERAGFSSLLEAGFVDTFRHHHPGEAGHYSWWTYRMNARARNIGWRIDYFLVSQGFLPRVKKSFIWPEITGSDHCPVGIEVDVAFK